MARRLRAARFSNITRTEDGFEGMDRGVRFRASFNLFLIREAWERGANMEPFADGFGPGMGTMGGDWSGIRDSTPQAKVAMLEVALNFLFGKDG
ncbi:MAG: hypothetical protein QOE90_3043 [Thermoplasmata archaeon]|jgi:hypothetical protein|nr:hypothetical protein [Thermoplasmata archaeon]